MVGANDIDEKMAKHYKQNLHPALFLTSDIKQLLTDKLPKELYELDILDGSPPCSTFSMSGNREDDWGKLKYFAEGQAAQVLDELFFDFVALAKRLQPKIVIAENVKGLVIGKAKGYLRQILQKLNDAGYQAQAFVVDASYCNVPQRRERVFIIGQRKDLQLGDLKISASKTPITTQEAFKGLRILESNKKYLDEKSIEFALWQKTKQGASFAPAFKKITGKDGRWDSGRINSNKPSFTFAAGTQIYHYDEPRWLTTQELVRLSSFPDDYIFDSVAIARFVMGMSVPPNMVQVVSTCVHDQWLSTL